MAEEERANAGASTNDEYREESLLPESPEDESLDAPVPQDSPDLKSVLVTSVLNLEQLDVDLYRCLSEV